MKKKKSNFYGELLVRLRTYFFTGILVTAPITLTFYLVWVVITFIDDKIKPVIPIKYYPEHYLHISIPGIGLLIVVISLTFIGALTAGVFGRLFIHWSERILNKMPVIRSVYGAMKQIFESVFSKESASFRKVVLIQYPRKGIWSLGFISGTTKGEVQIKTSDKVINVFLPTTPNPTSGFLLFLPRQDVILLDMSVEEGIKMVVSAGIITPPFNHQKKEN